jgi:hypothetical protein
MVTMATELFCLNKLLKSLCYFHVVFLSVVLRVKIFNLTIRDTNSKYCQILTIFITYNFFLKNNFYHFSLKSYFLCLMFCLSDILWQRIT